MMLTITSACLLKRLVARYSQSIGELICQPDINFLVQCPAAETMEDTVEGDHELIYDIL